MDRSSSTGAPGSQAGERQATVSSLVTSVVLLVGVLGGLVIVVTVILVCKYCQGKTKPPLRHQYSGSGRESVSERTLRALQRYETINSDIFSEHSTCSLEGPPLTPRIPLDFRLPDRAVGLEDATETTHSKSDFDKDDYTEAGEPEAVSGKERSGATGASRRVSFQLDHVTPSNYSGDFKFARYIEGDYHHLKHSKIGRPFSRQFSMGGAGSGLQGRVLLDDPHFRFLSLDERMSTMSSWSAGAHRDVGRAPSPKPKRDVLVSYQQMPSSPSPACRLSGLTSPSLSRESPPSTSSLVSTRPMDSKESPPSPFRPITELLAGSSPSPPYKAIRTQVSVEIHQHSTDSSDDQHQQLLTHLDRVRSYVQSSSPSLKMVPASRRRVQSKPVCSQSLESPRLSTYRETRQVKSYDEVIENHDVLEITEFSKGPFYNTDYDIISELGSPTGAKVRYNDTGSLEQLNEDPGEFVCALDYDDVTMHCDEADDSTDTLNGNRKYRALWRLRATLEEEEECSDTIRMEDMTSPDDSPDREHVTPNTTSFESNAQSDPCPSEHRDSGIQFESGSSKPASHANFLHPNYENRRQNYRNVFNNRLQKGNQSTSVENSLDSAETDGDVSDTSRYEVTTTSFESSTTTDNTDSTTESQASKLRQMKADSGYKSLETQQQNSEQEAGKWDYRASVECGEGIAARTLDSVRKVSHFERRTGKTASKKRREYSRERQAVQVYESINEPETDLHSGDSVEDSSIPNKISVFARFFKSHPRGQRCQYLVRDYSIDEKTNSIFNEFVRQEIPTTSGRLGMKKSPRLARHRLQRKHTEPVLRSEERVLPRDRLAPSLRSLSLGSDSSASSARRMSPQDSIEEEKGEDVVAERVLTCVKSPDVSRIQDQLQALAIHAIPIIKLPEEEAQDVS